jgi:serine/threonine-protein kinase
MLPGGGGVDLLGAKLGFEPDTVELIISDRVVYIVKPKRLIFESFDFDWEWNYFRLETGGLEIMGTEPVLGNYEEFVEIAPLEYVSQVEWDTDREGDRKFPPDPRHVCRYINGDFLILQKTSTYNRIPYTYDGRHSQMETDEFRDYIAKKVQLVQQILQDREAEKLAIEKGWTLDELIFTYLEEVSRQEFLEKYRKKF